MRAVGLLAGAVVLLWGCGEVPAGRRAAQAIWRDSAAHASGIVTVNGVRLNYLDWGGSGPALILVHGLGDSPHIFDDLAPAFTDRYRVVAYARRGHGQSEERGPYDGPTLAEDLRQLMDSLGIVRASLAGWSMGGNEVTRLAATHPDRVDQIVYLDAAYDWSEFGPGLETFPVTFDPDSAALSSFDRFRTWHLRTWFPDLTGADTMRVEAHLRQLVRDRAGGGGLDRVPGAETVAEIMATSLLADRRDYVRVRVPALAIYSETFLSTASGDSARIAAWERDWMVPFRAGSKARVRRELAQVEIVDVPGTHADFVFRSREQVVAAMRRFLDGARQR